MMIAVPDVLLLFPPPFAVEQPYLALPALTAFLRSKGVSVRQRDLSIQAFEYLTSADALGEIAREPVSGLTIGHDDTEVIIADTAKGKAFMRGQRGDFGDFDQYTVAYQAVERALELLSAAFHPARLTLGEYDGPHSPESSRQIMAGIYDEGTNVFAGFLRDYVQRQIAPGPPRLIGVSIATLSQVIPAFTLLRFLREFCPESKLVIGGVIPSHIPGKFARVIGFADYFDYLISGEGETPLWQLAEAVLEGGPVDHVPNLWHWDGRRFRQHTRQSIESIGDLPTPVYDGLPLRAYLSPEPVISVEPGRGCYYRKCVFCNQFTVHGESYRLRDPERFVQDLRSLGETHGARLFNFVNEGLPGGHLLRMAEAIERSELDVRWYAGARLEPKFDEASSERLYRAGCRKLMFGLETASQLLADAMKKGLTVRSVPRILKACGRAGIDVHLYLMVGFPGEKEEDVDLTARFVVKQLRNLDQRGFTFTVSSYAPVVLSGVLRSEGSAFTKGEEYDLEYVFLPPGGHEACAKAEERAKRLSDAIYATLPEQSIPEEITHYLVYKWASERGVASKTESVVHLVSQKEIFA